MRACASLPNALSRLCDMQSDFRQRAVKACQSKAEVQSIRFATRRFRHYATQQRHHRSPGSSSSSRFGRVPKRSGSPGRRWPNFHPGNTAEGGLGRHEAGRRLETLFGPDAAATLTAAPRGCRKEVPGFACAVLARFRALGKLWVHTSQKRVPRCKYVPSGLRSVHRQFSMFLEKSHFPKSGH